MNDHSEQFASDRIGVRGFLWRLAVATVSNGLMLLFLSWVVDGFDVDDPAAAFVAAALVALTTTLVWWAFSWLILPLSVLTLGLFSIVLHAVIVVAVIALMPGVRIDGLGSGVVVVVGVGLLGAALSALFRIDSEQEFDRRTARFARRRARRSPPHATDSAGTVFVQIDGLSRDVLRRALFSGDMPTLDSWFRDGSHHLVPWDTEWSSQTGVSQAGLLLGSTDDMPAFRWYEKDDDRTVVSNLPKSAALIEERRTVDGGLLGEDGSSYGNLFSGGAGRAVLTMSVAGQRKEGRLGAGYGPYFSSPHNVVRTVAGVLGDIWRERRAAGDQKRRGVRPRVHRGWSYAALRSFTTVIMRDICVHAVIADMVEGRPRIWVDLLGYDEVAHHSGIERADALEVLRGIDRQLGRIDRARRWAPRPYDVVVLSDHGQSQGETFLQRRGASLEDEVRRLCELPAAEHGDADVPIESRGYLTGALEAADTGKGVGAAMARNAAGQIEVEPDGPDTLEREDGPIVMASGNLGLVYLPAIGGRATREDIDAAHPGLIAGLVSSPEVGFVLVATRDEGSLVLGSSGCRWLADGRVEGADPLAPFGPHALAAVTRADGYRTVADLMVNSVVDPDTGEVAAFEELVGSHGGLGGEQTRAFLAVPEGWAPPERPLVGAAEVHHQILRWLA